MSGFCWAAARNGGSEQTSSQLRRSPRNTGNANRALARAGAGGEQLQLTRDFKQTIVERARRDRDFAKALLDEAATHFLNGEPQLARLILRDLVNATIGFEGLAVKMARPAKSLHRMLSKEGNPPMDSLAAILGALRSELGVELEAHTIKAA
jgi:DNA-binding phage protein